MPVTDNRTDFALLRMPYSALTQPAMATGLLKADLEKAGVACTVIPANLTFAERIGPVVHNLLFTSVPHSMIGEWTFAAVLHPELADPDVESYLDRAIGYFKVDSNIYWKVLCRSQPYLDMRLLLREIREQAGPFVDRIADQVLSMNPQIVGCTSVFQQHCASLAVLRRIKDLSPSTVTMIGGANCEGDLGRATFESYPWLDYVVSGDADTFIGSMSRQIIQDGQVPIDRLPTGVFARDASTDHSGNGRVPTSNGHGPAADGSSIVFLTNKAAAEAALAPVAAAEMEDVSIPNYDDWFAALSESRLGPYVHPSLPYMTSRGCWWGEQHHCTFCGISDEQMRYRAKSGDAVMRELKAMRDHYGINSFQGNEYILDMRYFKTLIPRLHELNSHFRFEVKANLRPRQIEQLRNAGVVEVQPGIESLNDEVLELLDKGTTAAINIRMLKAGVKYGMSIFWNLLHSVPGDEDGWYEQQAQLLPLLTHLQPPSAFAEIHYDRFSVYWSRPEDFGLELVPAWGYGHIYPFSGRRLIDMAYFFDNQTPVEKLFGSESAERPGLRHLSDALNEWQLQYRRLGGRQRPGLTIAGRDGQGIVSDTRDLDTDRDVVISGLDFAVLAAFDAGVTHAAALRAVRTELGDDGVQWPEVEVSIMRLIEQRLLLDISGKYISLPVFEPLRQYAVDEIDDPALVPDVGLIEADAAMAGQTLPAACVRTAWDMPMSELYPPQVELDNPLLSRVIWSP